MDHWVPRLKLWIHQPQQISPPGGRREDGKKHRFIEDSSLCGSYIICAIHMDTCTCMVTLIQYLLTGRSYGVEIWAILLLLEMVFAHCLTACLFAVCFLPLGQAG